MDLELIRRGLKKGVKFYRDFEEMLEAVEATKQMDDVVKELSVEYDRLLEEVKVERANKASLVKELIDARKAALVKVETERSELIEEAKQLRILRDAEREKALKQIDAMEADTLAALRIRDESVKLFQKARMDAEQATIDAKVKLEEAREAYRKFKAQL